MLHNVNLLLIEIMFLILFETVVKT